MARYFDIDAIVQKAVNPVAALEAVVCGNLDGCCETIMKGRCKNCPHMKRALNRGLRTGAPQNPEKPAVLGGIHVVYNHHGKKEVK